MRKLPRIKFPISNSCLPAGKVQFPIISILLFLLIFLSSYQRVNAAFSGGINIGDHFGEFDQAARTLGGRGWVYVMASPGDSAQINSWLNSYPNIQLVVRGHKPDNKGSSLTASFARDWAEALSGVSRTVYFMPVNEPNNPNESAGGISAATVVSYVGSLVSELSSRSILGSKVVLLSPAIDVFSMSDGSVAQVADGSTMSTYVRDLGGWEFFSQFSGISLNLYGQYNENSLDSGAPLIKTGRGYREFLEIYFGAPETEANSARIYALETGVLKTQDGAVKYRENSQQIADYFSQMRSVWGSDSNFVMYAIFSYDPGGDKSPWIYTDSRVLAAMGSGSTSAGAGRATSSAGDVQVGNNAEIAFGDEEEITKNSNERLLPKSILDKRREEQGGCEGKISIFGICTNIAIPGAKLAHETEVFQPGYVPKEKIVDENKAGGKWLANLFGLVIKPQTATKDTGALNAYRPGNLSFSQARETPAGQPTPYESAQANSESKVLAAQSDDQADVKDAYRFTMKMILPKSLHGLLAQGSGVKTQNTAQTTGQSGAVDQTVSYPSGSAGGSYGNVQTAVTLRELVNNASRWAGVPWQVIEAMLVIEGSGYRQGMDLAKLNIGVFGLTSEEIIKYSAPNVEAPLYCQPNVCSAAGVGQMTTVGCSPFQTCASHDSTSTLNADCAACPGACSQKPAAWNNYKDAVLEYENDGRTPNICNIKDSVFAATRMIKVKSGTEFGVLTDWNKDTLYKVGRGYYGGGGCEPCGSGNEFSEYGCNRLGKNYCDFLWDYYQANKNIVPVPVPTPGVVAQRVYYSQDDPQLNQEVEELEGELKTNFLGGCTLSKAGCGPTTLAMILATFVDAKYKPAKALQEFYPKSDCATTPWEARDALEAKGFITFDIFDLINSGKSYMTYAQALGEFRTLLDAGWQIWGNADINGSGHHFWITGYDGEGRMFVMDPKYGLGKPYPMAQPSSNILYKRAFAFKLK